MKHKDQVCTLIYLKKGIKIDKQSVHIDCINLVSRPVILERSDILSHCFKYERTLSFTLLFKHSAYKDLQGSFKKIH